MISMPSQVLRFMLQAPGITASPDYKLLIAVLSYLKREANSHL
jgi:hypothetical protein